MHPYIYVQLSISLNIFQNGSTLGVVKSVKFFLLNKFNFLKGVSKCVISNIHSIL